MTYEMKDILKTMVDNNEPHWTADTMNMVREEIELVYAQAVLKKEKIKQIEETYKVRYSEHIELKRKADEYEAKAIILDRVKEFATEPPFLLANNEHEDYELYAYDQILRLIEKYESGESD